MDERQAAALITAPCESLTVEVKSWLDLTTPGHQAKLVRALLALRNYNGGLIIIDFDDKTKDPASEALSDIRASYHSDTIQQLVSKYASDPFGVEVMFPQKDSGTYPVIQVPAGVQIPVAIKSDLKEGKAFLLRAGDVMFRTLAANNTVSSAPARPADWSKIMDICFSNREADLAGFVRRHLMSGDLLDVLAEVGKRVGSTPRASLQDRCSEFASECATRAQTLMTERRLGGRYESFGWVEVTAVVDPHVDGQVADTNFFHKMMQSHPHFSNELWMDTRGFIDQADRPQPYAEGWEVLSDLSNYHDLLEFYRLEPQGRFFLKRPVEVDASATVRKASPGIIMELDFAIMYMAEAMMTALAFANSVANSEEESQMGFLIKYHGLKGRRLVSLTGDLNLMFGDYRCQTDSWIGYVEVPVMTPSARLGPHIFQVARRLLALFSGYLLTPERVDRDLQAVTSRRAI